MKIARKIVRRMIDGYRRIKETYELPEAAGKPIEIPLRVKETGGRIVKPIEFPLSVSGVGEIEIPVKITPIVPKTAIPTKLESPMEVKGELALKPPEIKKEIKGFEIPSLTPVKPREPYEAKEKKEMVKLSYPLVPREPKEGEPVLAYAEIYWDEKKHRHVYQLVEPKLTPSLKKVLGRIKVLLEERLDIEFSKLNIIEAKEYLKKRIEELVTYFKFKLTEEEKKVLKYYIERDFLGLGKIEPLMRDPNIEDISCDGVGIPIFVFHRNPILGSLVTNITFDDAEELDSFITKLVQICGKSISVAEPLVDGTLPDGSRLQATLATDIARKGSNFTIRKFTEEPLTPIHLLSYGTIDVRTLAYLWLAVDYGRSIMVSGGTASGKTTMLNVLSLFIPPDKKVVSIEDTAELKLPHPHWVPTVARTPIATGKAGEVDLFMLLKESLRQRPDYIVVGEVRGKEAYILFQQIATGHPSLATIHAENIDKLLDRLTTPPISLPPSLLGSLDMIVFMSRLRYKQKFVRKVSDVVEIVEFPAEAKKPIVNIVFHWNPLNDSFETSGKSVILERIAKTTGMSKKEITEELKRRMFVLNWMKEKNIVDYKSVYTVVNLYYTYPSRVLAAIGV